MLTELKLHTAIQYFILKKHIENKAKQRWYYNHLPKCVAKGFTLAEILVTLTIVGVIASLTVPALVNNINNTTNVVQLKKFYSDIQQAFILLQAENGGSIVPVFQNDTTTNNGNGNALNSFLTKLNYTKNCNNAMGCWYNSPRYYLNGSTTDTALDASWNGQYEKGILSNGSMILIQVTNTNCTANWGAGPLNNGVCGYIYIDLNGFKGPNTIGRDYFGFYVTQTGIYPRGSFNDGYSCNTLVDGYNNSLGCAAKVLTEGAMNY